MRARTIQILAAVTVLVAVAAALALKSRESRTAVATKAGSSLFPELHDKVNDVASVTIKGAKESFSIERADKTWGAKDKGGFPVEFDKVKELVVGISQFAVVERMTSDPARHAKLGVEDPVAPEAKSKQVTLKDKGGAVLADVVIGEPRKGGGEKPTLYVRKAGDNQAFEVTGRLTIDDQLTNWLDKQIAKLDKKRVHRVVVRHPDGTELALSKPTLEEENFTVENLPEGAELSWPGVANGIAGALEWLNLEDVKPALEVDLAGDVTTTTFTTFDGLVITALTQEKDEKVYLKLSAAFDEAARVEPAGPPTPEKKDDAAEGDAEKKDEAASEEPKPAGKTPDEVRKEVETLNAKVQPWAYVVPGYGAANLRKKLEDLLKKPEPAGPPAEGEGELPELDENGIEPPITDEPTPPPAKEEKPPETPPAEPPVTPPSSGGGV